MDKKRIFKVGGLLMALVIVFVVWQLMFNDGGIVKTGYNWGVGIINTQAMKITGGTTGPLPTWDDTGAKKNERVLDFDIK